MSSLVPCRPFPLSWAMLALAVVPPLCGCAGSAEPRASDRHAVDRSAAARAAASEADAVLAHGGQELVYDTGVRQSPIDIRTDDVVAGQHHIAINYGPSQGHIRNTGHTVRLDYDRGSFVAFDGSRYDLQQFHFHTPSEHKVDGRSCGLEMHMVHRKSGGIAADPHYLVVGVLYEPGPADPFLATFLDSVPADEDGQLDVAGMRVAVGLHFGDELQRYYHYQGSLTTPPYTETVEWVVLQRVFTASDQQIERLRQLEGDNARDVQELHGRHVDVPRDR